MHKYISYLYIYIILLSYLMFTHKKVQVRFACSFFHVGRSLARQHKVTMWLTLYEDPAVNSRDVMDEEKCW